VAPCPLSGKAAAVDGLLSCLACTGRFPFSCRRLQGGHTEYSFHWCGARALPFYLSSGLTIAWLGVMVWGYLDLWYIWHLGYL
jgi:hypothetical protein